MQDQTWWTRQMDGSRAKYALCSGGFDAAGVFVHDGRYCKCGEAQSAETADVRAEYGTAWVCTDCYFAHHYGAHEHGGEWFAGESDSPCDREPLALLEGYELADNTYPDGDNPEDPDETGEQDFSWRSCDGCGSTLGGSRHRLATFTPRRTEG